MTIYNERVLEKVGYDCRQSFEYRPYYYNKLWQIKSYIYLRRSDSHAAKFVMTLTCIGVLGIFK